MFLERKYDVEFVQSLSFLKVTGVYTVNTIANNTQSRISQNMFRSILNHQEKIGKFHQRGSLLNVYFLKLASHQNYYWRIGKFHQWMGFWSWRVPCQLHLLLVSREIFIFRLAQTLSSRSEWQTVSEWEEADEEVHTLCIPVVPWKLVPIDIPPSWLFHLGIPGVDSKDINI